MGSLQRSYERTELGKLTPDYVAGFVDGEGSFSIVIAKHKQKRLGLDARLIFGIELRDDDLEILPKNTKYIGLWKNLSSILSKIWMVSPCHV